MAYRNGCGTGFDEIDDGYLTTFFTTIAGSTGFASWATTPNEGQNGRCLKLLPNGNQAIVYVTKNIGENLDELIICMNYKQTLTPGSYFEAGFIADAGVEQMKFRVLGDTGQVAIYRGESTLLETTARALNSGAWYYLQFKIKIHDTAGAYEFRVNNVDWASDSDVDTQAAAGQAYANGYKLLAKSATSVLVTSWIDDIAILDTTGGVNDDFISAAKHVYCKPTSDAHADFTPSLGGDNYAEVDAVAPDFVPGAKYNSSTTAGHYDLFGCAEPEDADANVLAVISSFVAKKELIGDGALRHIVHPDGDVEDYRTGAQEALGDSYLRYTYAWETNPAGGSWTFEDAVDAQIGYEIPALV